MSTVDVLNPIENVPYDETDDRQAAADSISERLSRLVWKGLAAAAVFTTLALLCTHALPTPYNPTSPSSFGPFTGNDMVEYLADKPHLRENGRFDRLMQVAREAGDKPFVAYVTQHYGGTGSLGNASYTPAADETSNTGEI